MNFNNHLTLKGRHALLSPSQPSFLNAADYDEVMARMVPKYSSLIGTTLHAFAEERIRYGFKINKNDKRTAQLELLKANVPAPIINYIDFDNMYDNLMAYVNDCIGFKMQPEVILYLSEVCFGTADAISYNEKTGLLRIHDLKTGTTPAHIEQLMTYAALFFLEYRAFKLSDSQVELRIYQNNEVYIDNPGPDDLLPLRDKIKTLNDYVLKIQGGY